MIRTLTRYSSLSLLLILSFLLTSCLDSSTNNNNQNLTDLLDTAKGVTQDQSGDPVLTNFVGLLEDTSLDSTIANDGPFTAIMPIDSAFNALPGGNIGPVGPNLVNIANYHLVDGIVNLNQLPQQDQIQSLQGENLYFEIRSNVTSNSNQVFVNGGRLLARIDATNGIIYVTDKVLFPDSYLEVPGLIEKRYQLNDLNAAIEDADLTDALSDTSQGFTVFAPSNQAIGEAELSADQLQYHVIPEKLIARDLNSQSYTTLSDQDLTVEISGGSVTINGNATVTTADIEGTNGVVHIIDSVLSPSQ